MIIFDPAQFIYDENIKYYNLNSDKAPHILKKNSYQHYHASAIFQIHQNQDVTLKFTVKKNVHNIALKKILFRLDDIKSKCEGYFTTDTGKKYLKKHFSINSFDQLKIRALIDETPNKYNCFVRPRYNIVPEELHTLRIDTPSFTNKKAKLNNTFYMLDVNHIAKKNNSHFANDHCYIELSLKKDNKLHHMKIRLYQKFEH